MSGQFGYSREAVRVKVKVSSLYYPWIGNVKQACIYACDCNGMFMDNHNCCCVDELQSKVIGKWNRNNFSIGIVPLCSIGVNGCSGKNYRFRPRIWKSSIWFVAVSCICIFFFCFPPDNLCWCYSYSLLYFSFLWFGEWCVAQKCEGNLPPEWRKFSVDPQITSVEVLYSILAKAFDLKTDFSISYKTIDPMGQEVFLAVLSDWDLDAAFLRAHNLSIARSSEPCLNLRVDIKPFSETTEWESASNAKESSPIQQSIGVGQKYVQNMQNRLPGLIMNHVCIFFLTKIPIFCSARNRQHNNVYLVRILIRWKKPSRLWREHWILPKIKI